MKEYTDTERLDYLQERLGTYSNRVVCRWSMSSRGWRLHETSGDDSVNSVRKAIDNFIRENTNESN